jgi:DNA-binding CsgD family transcriptional regulator/tetratricopeptide (TPR) repeat protein
MNLLEREHCLADLQAWHRSLADGGGCIVLIAGEAGVGKTSLLQAFARQNPPIRVLWGACDALYTPRPLAPLHDIGRQVSGALAAAVVSGATRDVTFPAALDELDRPGTVMIFEDVHWADEATLDLLKYLGRRIHRARGMIAVTYRDDEVGARHPLRVVIGDLPRSSTRRLTLEPLSESAVELLARQAQRPANGLHRITAGNPLFVTEVLASHSNTIPITVRDAVLARTSRLSQAARSVAEFVSVIPGKAEAWLLSEAVRADEVALDECLSIGMVRHEDGALSYRHELVRRALEDSLSPSRQRQLHASALKILRARPQVPAARLAHHAAGACDAAEVLRQAPVAAAQAAAVGAHREASVHLEAALRHAAACAPEERAPLHERLSYECYLIDDIERAIAERRAALEIWRSCEGKIHEGDALRWLSRLSWFAGRRSDADRYAAESIEALEPLGPSAELAMAYSNRAQLDMLAHDGASAVHWAERAITLAERLKDREILSHALNNLGTARHSSGDPSGLDDLTRSLQLALDGGFQEHAARAYTNLSSQAVASRQYDRALRHLAQGMAYCEDRDLDSWRAYMLAWRARAKFEQSDWLAAAEDAAQVLRGSGTAPVSRIPALTVLAHLRIRRGDPDIGSPLDEAVGLALRTGELQRIGPLAAAQAEAAWLQGDLRHAREAVRDAYELARTRHDPWMKGELAAWLRRANALEDTPSDIAPPYLFEISGDWQQAADTWRALGCPYEQALILGWYGGEPEQREALTLFQRLGAIPATEALRRRMLSLGIRGVPRGARPSTQGHPFGLTRREAQILDLMHDGLRNAAIAKRLYLSTRTVDHHVSTILGKLGAKSRTEAIDIARRSRESAS